VALVGFASAGVAAVTAVLPEYLIVGRWQGEATPID
jgi:hypothetical protein